MCVCGLHNLDALGLLSLRSREGFLLALYVQARIDNHTHTSRCTYSRVYVIACCGWVWPVPNCHDDDNDNAGNFLAGLPISRFVPKAAALGTGTMTAWLPSA